MKQVMSGSNVVDITKFFKKKCVKEDPIKNDPSLSDLIDALVQITIYMDGLGLGHYADRIAEITEDLFEDPHLDDEK